MNAVAEIVLQAWRKGLPVPSFNIPYLPMMEPVVRAVVDQDAFALIATARLEWIKFQAGGPAQVMQEFRRCAKPGYVSLHLDHVPAIDEDGFILDVPPVIQDALALGYQSVMVDGSRLPLAENVALTRRCADLAHQGGVPCEAELGAVLGHEAGPLPPYEVLFETGMGFTDVQQAGAFARQTGCDWLSVAVGNVHGAVSAATRDQKKVEARLNLEHLERLRDATGIPLVLHGGSGIKQDLLLVAYRRGIAKVNIATDLRQPYEASLRADGYDPAGPTAADAVDRARQVVYQRTCAILSQVLQVSGRRSELVG